MQAPAPSVPTETSPQSGRRPSFVFFGVIATLSLLADVSSKAWAEIVLSKRTLADPSIEVVKDHLSFTLAYNKGGAWGLLQDQSEYVRRPFFLGVSVLAVVFIVSLYSRLAPGQRALKWGLPLVLGGALGNLTDRVVRSSVVDFIDYRADWVESMNRMLAAITSSLGSGWAITDHWPTYNVADIAICVGVGLMAIDMFFSHRQQTEPATANADADESRDSDAEMAAPSARTQREVPGAEEPPAAPPREELPAPGPSAAPGN